MFFPKQNGQQVHEKMFSLTNHERNATKTIMRYNFTPIGIDVIKNTRQQMLLRSSKGKHFAYWCECQLVQLLWKIVIDIPQKLKIELPNHLGFPFLGIYPK